MSKPAKMRLATDEDLRKIYGSAGLLISSPVRPNESERRSSTTPPEQPSEPTPAPLAEPEPVP